MFGSSSLSALGWVLAIAGTFSAWGLTELKAKWFDTPAAVSAAVNVERERGAAELKAKLAEVQTKLATAAAENKRLAEEAERSIEPTPTVPAEIKALCDRSASCRDRQKGKTP